MVVKKLVIPERLLISSYWSQIGIKHHNFDQFNLCDELKEWVDAHDGITVHQIGSIGAWLSFKHDNDYIEFKLTWL